MLTDGPTVGTICQPFLGRVVCKLHPVHLYCGLQTTAVFPLREGTAQALRVGFSREIALFLLPFSQLTSAVLIQ